MEKGRRCSQDREAKCELELSVAGWGGKRKMPEVGETSGIGWWGQCVEVEAGLTFLFAVASIAVELDFLLEFVSLGVGDFESADAVEIVFIDEGDVHAGAHGDDVIASDVDHELETGVVPFDLA